MTNKRQDTGGYLHAARELAPRVAADADRIDRERRLPPKLAIDLADAGLFRLLVPRLLGGAELDLPSYLEIVQVLAEADASVAWCVNQNNVFATNSVRMPPETAREIWDDPRAIVTNGPPAPSSIALPVDGGYRLTGRWDFSSGIRNASWVAALTPVEGDGEEDPTAVHRRGLVLLVPAGDVELIDVWQVSGLRGTGSLSFRVDDLFVPARRTFRLDDPPRHDGAIYVVPTALLFAAGFATTALGVARSALDELIELAGGKTPVLGRVTLRETAATQRQVGKAEAVLRSARAYLREAVSALWNGAIERGALTDAERVGLRLAGTHAIRMAADVVDVAYDLAGASSVFETGPIQRRFQDVHVITQQVQGRMAHYDTAGRFFLGLESDGLV